MKNFQILIILVIISFLTSLTLFLSFSFQITKPQQGIKAENPKILKKNLSQTNLDEGKRQFILSQKNLVRLEEIDDQNKLRKLWKAAKHLQDNIQTEKVKIFDIPFRDSFVYLIYTKAEKGIVNLIKEEEMCVYKPSTLLVLSTFVKPYFKIIDGGSHFGIFSLRIASFLDPFQEGKLFSFEPNPFSVRFLNSSI